MNRFSSERHRPFSPVAHIPPGTHSLIDIGCNVGDLLRDALRIGVRDIAGVDLNEPAVRTAKQRLPGYSQSLHACSADELPFEDGRFDVASCCEVLEHVPSPLRAKVVREIARVLKPEGRLILTVPAAGMFAWMDPANARYRLPWLWRLVSRPLGGGGRDAGYAGQKHGVVWHHHFTLHELRRLLEPHFGIGYVRHRGAFVTPIANALFWPLYRTGAYDSAPGRALRWVEDLDMSFDCGPTLGYNVLIVAERPPGLGSILVRS